MRFLILLFPFLFFACAKTEIDSHKTDTGEDFFPVSVGKYRTYQIDSIIYKASGSPDTLFGQIRETIVEALVHEADTSFRVLREWRTNADANWETNSVWWIVKEGGRMIQTEENIKFIKLPFAVREGVSWDGNAFFDSKVKLLIGEENLEFFKEWSYQITSIQSEVINGQAYDNVVTVEEANFETAIELRHSIAKYAKGIGLVERTQQILDTQCIPCEEPWSSKAEKGVILTQILIDYN